MNIIDLELRKPNGSLLHPMELIEMKEHKGRIRRLVKCKCECGEEITVRFFEFYTKKSCGCLIAKYHIPVGQPRSKYPLQLRKVYRQMMERCYRPHHVSYKYWGGKGVSVCDEWKGKQDVFCEWAIRNGWEPELQLDKDIKGSGFLYSPESCCFVTRKRNYQAKPSNKKYLFRGENLCLSQISDITGIDLKLIWHRIVNSGWSVEDAATVPPIKAGETLLAFKNKLEKW